MGASTAGVRIPPSTTPLASTTSWGGVVLVVCRRAAACGRVPWATQRLSAWIAARSTKVCGPVLMGTAQVKFGLGWFGGLLMVSNQSATV